MADNDNDNDNVEMDFDDLTEEQKAAILQNPDVQKSLRYQDGDVQDAYGAFSALMDADEDSEQGEAYELLVTGVAERSGRVTENTVQKVLTSFVEEVGEVTESG